MQLFRRGKKSGVLKDFFNREEVNNYFDLLYKNQISTIDLTKEVNLKAFAKVLRSFSRAKTLDINKSKSLQDFLFEDNEETKTIFDVRKEVLNEHIRNYHKLKVEIDTLKQKQAKLEHLKSINAAYKTAEKEYLSKNARLLFNLFKTKEKALTNNEAKWNKAFDDCETYKKEYAIQSEDFYSKAKEQKATCQEIETRLKEQQAEAGKQNTDSLKEKLRTDTNFNERLEKLKPIVDEYKTKEAILPAFAQHESLRGQKMKLDDLQKMKEFDEFKKSKWSKDYAAAYDFYTKRSQVVLETVKMLKEVMALYEGNNPTSFFNWIVKNNEVLSREQETVVMNFKEIFVKKISFSQGKRFTLNPKNLLNSFDKEGEGIWIHLGNVSEYFPLVPKQIFNEKGKLQQAIEKNKEHTKREREALETELAEIEKLNAALLRIGYNEKYFEIYVREQELEKWQANKLYTEENINFVIDYFDSFSKIEDLKTAAHKLNSKIDKTVVDARLIEINRQQNQADFTEAQMHYAKEIEKEYLIDFKRYGLEKLIELRTENKQEIIALERKRDKTKMKRDEQTTIIDNCREVNPSLKSDKESSEKIFKEAKTRLEENTDLVFDSLLQLGDVTQDMVNELKTQFEKLQEIYRSEYTQAAEMFEESKAKNNNPEIYSTDRHSYYNFHSLVNLLCGKIGLENLTNKLSDLNDNLKMLGELQLKILTEVFTLVEKQYKDFSNAIQHLNFFFERNKISDEYKFRVEFVPKKDINIDWIQKMKDKTRVYKQGIDLFTNPDDWPSPENTPENLIRAKARQFYRSVNPEPSNLLDPKYYFTIHVKMEDDEGKQNVGSGGQAYTALALLCIGRLSIVQKHQEKNLGVKFIIIEELSNIDDANFSIFPQIAERYGYQLITMTPKPFGSYTDEEWYLHMLIKGKEDKFRNYTPMSFFKTKSKNRDFEKYLMEQNELEDS